jgi:hypothetical protein
MSTIINATTTTGVVIQPDNSGSLALQTNNGTAALTIDTSQNVAFAKGFTVGATAAPAFSAYQSSSQSLTSSTWTKITFDTEEFDTNSNFASSRFTPTVAGYYQINGVTNAGSYGAALTRSMVQIYKNGSGYKYGTDLSPAGSNGVAIVSSLVYLNGSTDYVEIYGFITATSPATTSGGSLVYFNGSMVRSA